MKKLFLIGWKDVTLVFRDRAALIFMLLAPFLLTLGLGAVTGRFSGGSSSTGISDIPVVIVNLDDGQIGQALVDLFNSNDLQGLVKPTANADPASARQLVDANKAAAAILIPVGFSQDIFSPQEQAASAKVLQIEVYGNPTAPTSVGVIKTIVDGFINQVEVGSTAGQVAVTQLISSGRIQPQDAAAVGQQLGVSQANAAASNNAIILNNVTPSGEAVKFDVLALLAPGMALMFLMFTTSNGGRSLLTERNQGTLPRLLVSPTSAAQILGGKVVGIFLSGAAQMLILILGTTLLFQLQWGDPLAVVVLVLAAVFAATGWGMLITAVARTPAQISAIGSAILLIFGILGGTFVNMDIMPGWFRVVSRISPNAWGVDAFTTLALGGRLPDVLTPVLALTGMGALLFVVSVFLFNRRGGLVK